MKPCPICGSSAVRVSFPATGGCIIACSNCLLTPGMETMISCRVDDDSGASKANLIAVGAWNNLPRLKEAA